MRPKEPRTLVRPLAYAVSMLTLGGAVTLLLFLLVVGASVALVSPYLALTADQAVIGPFTVRTLPESLMAALLGAGVLLLLTRLAPTGTPALIALTAGFTIVFMLARAFTLGLRARSERWVRLGV